MVAVAHGRNFEPRWVSVGRMWTVLLPGLEYAELTLPPSTHGDSIARVVRVDLTRFELRMAMASAGEDVARPIPDWQEVTGAVVAVNAGMYETDYRTSTGAMWGSGHVNNPTENKYRSVLAFDPVDPEAPVVRRYDLGCGDTIDSAKAEYRAGVQSIRMVDCHRANVWGTSARRWSSVVLGVDGAGRLLIVHTRSPYAMRALTDALLAAPLDLRALQYAEGGPEATLSIEAGTMDSSWIGSYETGFWENDDNHDAWPVPNAILVVPRPQPVTAPIPTP